MITVSYEAILADTIEVTSNLAKKPVTENTNLVADLELDSIGIAELVADIEDRFKVVIPMERLPTLRTVRDVAQNLVPLVNASDNSEGI
jgi:acyl carrier protein